MQIPSVSAMRPYRGYFRPLVLSFHGFTVPWLPAAIKAFCGWYSSASFMTSYAECFITHLWVSGSSLKVPGLLGFQNSRTQIHMSVKPVTCVKDSSAPKILQVWGHCHCSLLRCLSSCLVLGQQLLAVRGGMGGFFLFSKRVLFSSSKRR